MSREIKFRAWDGEKIIHHIPNSAVTTGSFLEMMGTTLKLMQYTGLKDKNGKEIYECDLVRIDKNLANLFEIDEKFNIVKFFRGTFCISDKDGVQPKMGDLTALANMEGNNLRGEIIGNIYENPELLSSKI